MLLLKYLVVISSFCAYIHIYHGISNVHHEAFRTTVAIKTHAEIKHLRRTPSFWKLKLALFHILSFPAYIAHVTSDYVFKEIRTLFWGMLFPSNSLSLMIIQLFWTTSFITTLLSTRFYSIFCAKQVQGPNLRSVRIPPQQRNHPDTTALPQNLMVLSSVMLLMTFVGEMKKYGLHWTPFNSLLHNIGQAAITRSIRLRTRNRRTIRHRFHFVTCLLMAAHVVPAVVARRTWRCCSNSVRAHWQSSTFRRSPYHSFIRQSDDYAFKHIQMIPSSASSTTISSSERSSDILGDPGRRHNPYPPCLNDPNNSERINTMTQSASSNSIDNIAQASLILYGTNIPLNHKSFGNSKHVTQLGHINGKINIAPERLRRATFPIQHSQLILTTDTYVLASNAVDHDNNNAFNFVPTRTEFGTDNRATQHICGVRNLFCTMRDPTHPIGVKGISGVSSAKGIGTIKFVLTDDDGQTHNVTLDNVIYLPGAIKNLISVSQWSREKQDNCAILSRGSYSVFVWENDTKYKTIEHPPSCAIPMMPVNEAMDSFALFVNKHSAKLNQVRAITEDGSMLEHHPPKLNSKKVTWSDQQSSTSPSGQLNTPTSPDISTGDTVRVWLDGRWVIAIIDRVSNNSSGNTAVCVRRLNSRQKANLPRHLVRPIQPDPSDFPSSPSEVDAAHLTHTLSKDELAQLWNPKTDDTVAPASRLTLYWHHRLRCAPLRILQRLSARGVLPSCIQHVRTMPLCASCAFATAHRKGWRTKRLNDSRIRKPHQIRPGDGTSCDHIISHQPGLIPQVSGTLTNKRYWGSVIYCDHHSDFIFNHLITSTSSAETLASKHAYERIALQHNVIIKAYHADNLRFNDNNFRGSCLKSNQHLTFCAVGAHHQNAIAESKVKMVCNGARTILLHAKRKWPAVISHVLWPFAMQCIVDRHNRLSLDENNKSPLEKFPGIEDEPIPTHFHTFGCPVFILDSPNQSGSIGTPKWQPRSHTGIYLGHSPCHASSVALVLNLRTGLVSPQFHVVYDDEFTTVDYLTSSTPPPNWLHLVRVASERASFDDSEPPPSWLYPPTTTTERNTESSEQPSPLEDTTSSLLKSTAPGSPRKHSTLTDQHPTERSDCTTDNPDSQSSESAGEEVITTDSAPFISLETLGLRRSPRIAALPSFKYNFIALAMSAIVAPISPVVDIATSRIHSTITDYHDYLNRNLDGSPNQIGPLAQAYLSSTNDNEVYTLKQMLQQPDRDRFVEAMQKEVTSMFESGIFRRVPKQEMFDHLRRQREKGLDAKRPQIMMIWSFKRKRNPDGTLNKHKARLCCHGGQQQ